MPEWTIAAPYMPITKQVLRYGGAIVAAAIALFLRRALEASFGAGLPTYITFYPLLMAAALLGGFGPGVLATLASAAAVLTGVFPRASELPFGSPIDHVGLVIFIGMGLAMSVVAEIYRRNRNKAAMYERETAYRESEVAFRVMANTLPQLASIANRDGEVVWLNDRWYEYTGTTPAQMLGRGWQSVYSASDLPTVLERWQTSLLAGLAFEMTFPLRGADGLFRQFLTRFSPLKDASGQVQQWFGTSTDVEDLAQAAAALRESEERWRYALAASGLGAWELNLFDHTAWRSPRHDEIFGYATMLPQWTYETFLEHVIDEDRPSVDSLFQRAISAHGDWSFECRIRRVDGELRWIWAYGKHINDSEQRRARLFGLVADITERKCAEEKLVRSEALYRGIGESIEYGVWVCDSAGRNTYVSDSFLEMVGMTPEQCSNLGWSELLPPEDVAPTVDAWQECVRTGGRWEREHRFRAVDGLWRHVLSRGVPIRDGEGRIVCWAGINLDITALKKTEEKLRVATEIAERANEAKSRFLAAASHDLRQPLAALGIYVSGLNNRSTPPDQKTVVNMKKCVDGLSRLLGDLLDLSKLSAGVVEVSNDDFAVSEIFESLRSIHRPVAEAKGISLRFRPARIAARTDPVLLQRILGNFIDNAVRFTTCGGVVVGCRRREGKFFAEVWDSGPGIPDDKTTEIFEEFKQLRDQARNRGSGLGLAIAAKTAALLGLEIQVRSRLGRGSVFAIEIPPGKDCGPRVRTVRTAVRSPLLIAVVEDNSLVREALQSTMPKDGHELVCAASGDELLASLGALSPDFIIADYRLENGVTGLEVISDLRKRYDEDLPAIIISGDTDPALLRDLAERGIAMLHKPLDVDELHAYIADMVEASIADAQRSDDKA